MLGLTIIAGAMMPLISCGCNDNNEGKEEERDEEVDLGFMDYKELWEKQQYVTKIQTFETNKIYKTKVKIITPPSSCQSSSNDGDYNFYNIMFIGSEEYVESPAQYLKSLTISDKISIKINDLECNHITKWDDTQSPTDHGQLYYSTIAGMDYYCGYKGKDNTPWQTDDEITFTFQVKEQLKGFVSFVCDDQ